MFTHAPRLPESLLAQANVFSSGLSAMAYAAIAVTVVVGSIFALRHLRGRITGPSAPSAVSVSALEELRRLRDTGRLTQAEFDAARLKLISKVSGRIAQERAAQAAANKGVTPGSTRGTNGKSPGVRREGPNGGYSTGSSPDAPTIGPDNSDFA